MAQIDAPAGPLDCLPDRSYLLCQLSLLMGRDRYCSGDHVSLATVDRKDIRNHVLNKKLRDSFFAQKKIRTFFSKKRCILHRNFSVSLILENSRQSCPSQRSVDIVERHVETTIVRTLIFAFLKRSTFLCWSNVYPSDLTKDTLCYPRTIKLLTVFLAV